MDFEIPPGKVLANGHVYKIHFAGDPASNEEIARALQDLGVVKVEHAMAGGTNVVVTPTIKQKENA